MIHFTAYIDEAGDEGLTKLREEGTGQSDWLILGGIIVREDMDRELVQWRDELIAMFPNGRKREIHFRHLKHDQRVAITRALSERQMGICCICSNKRTLLDGGKFEALFSQKGHLYNYLTRFLLERLTYTVAMAGRKAGMDAKLSVVFSRRANIDYKEMSNYFTYLRDGREKIKPVRSIDWTVFDPSNIKVENHSRWAGLQLADVATSAVFMGLEPNFYGNQEPRYALELGSRFIKRSRSILDAGLTLVPPLQKNPLSKGQREFVETLARS